MKIKKSIRAALFILLSLIAVTLILISRTKKSKEENLQQVSICKIQEESIMPEIETFGTIMFKTKNDITCLQSGNVESKKVTTGDFVKKGQVLYILKNSELEIQLSQYQNSLNSSLANISLYEAKLEEKKRSVKSNIITINNKSIEIKTLKEQIENSKSKLEKSRDLAKLGGISEQALTDTEIEFQQMCNSLTILEQEQDILSLGYTENDLLENGIVPSKDPAVFQQQLIELNSRSAQADLSVAKADCENAKKNITLITKLIDDLTVRSPVAGIVGATYFEKGEFVNNNEKILTIMDTSTCIASLSLQESNINNVSIGLKTHIVIPSIDKNYISEISEISPFTDTTTGNFTVSAFIDNPDYQLKPGMFAKCLISTDVNKTYSKLPETSLFNISGNKANYFIVKNNIALQQTIDFEFIKDGFAYTNESLTKDISVIDYPSKKIKDGTRVKAL